MITELLCTAVAVGLYVNTLDADFCYDDRLTVKLSRVNGVNDPADVAGSALMPAADMICELCVAVSPEP
ncbi:unnamed protein product, partial [Lampetra planeri]